MECWQLVFFKSNKFYHQNTSCLSLTPNKYTALITFLENLCKVFSLNTKTSMFTGLYFTFSMYFAGKLRLPSGLMEFSPHARMCVRLHSGEHA